MKRRKRIIAILLMATMVLMLAMPAAAKTRQYSIGGKMTVRVGQAGQLSLSNPTGKIRWASSNKKVITIRQNGVWVAKKRGKAVITAKMNGRLFRLRVVVKKAK